MADVSRLRNLLDDFVTNSIPLNANNSAPCTVGELKKVIVNLESLLMEFIKEMDED